MIESGEELTLGFVDPEAVRDVFSTHLADTLVNNAGIIGREDSGCFTEADWDAVMDVNLKTVFFICQEFAKVALPRGGGKVVNIASLLPFLGRVRVPFYAAFKRGVAGLTKVMANEWAALGINVNAIAKTAVFLASTAANYIHGTILNVDGDRFAR